MIVRFASVCDACQARSPEYTAWASCRECGADVCPACAAPGTLIEADLDAPETVVCRPCQAVLA
jgi:hypothetical protein